MIRLYLSSSIPGIVAYSQLCLVNMPFATKLLHSASRESVGGRQMGSEAFLGPVYNQVGSLSRGLKIARLHKRNASGRVTLLPGTELRPVSFNKHQCNKTSKHFSRNIHGAHMFPNVSQFPMQEILFPVSVFVCKLCLHYTAGNFNENQSMR